MSNQKIRIAIFPAGSEIGLEIFNSLKYNLHLEIFGVSGKSDNASFVYDSEHYIEDNFYISNSNFIDLFNDFIDRFNIQMIFPTHDSITRFLAENQSSINARVLTSPASSTKIAREKRKTYELFADCEFCPQVFAPPYENISFPAFAKPNEGQGGKGSSIITSHKELKHAVARDNSLVITEYLPGSELSVDCFTNRHGELLFIGPRTRDRVTMGISFRSRNITLTSEIETIGTLINERVKIQGAWFFQVKKDSQGKYKLLEFAVRQASTMGLYRQLGVNFALLTIFDALNKDVTILKNDYLITLDRSLRNRYKSTIQYNKVYIDFDDTVIINNHINETAVRFLYQCKRSNIPVILLTKHIDSIEKTLDYYCVSSKLFKKIISISMDDDKLRYIKPENSIYIDNYFLDRQRVSEKFGIPVFDVDAIESLIS